MNRYAPAIALAAAAVTSIGAMAQATAPATTGSTEQQQAMQQHPYIGMWVTADGHIRQELLPNGRYDEARGARQSAYQGRYEIDGNTIFYWDDTGFTADGVFVSDDDLHHGGMIFFRRGEPEQP